jgi:hypothetical protein
MPIDDEAGKQIGAEKGWRDYLREFREATAPDPLTWAPMLLGGRLGPKSARRLGGRVDPAVDKEINELLASTNKRQEAAKPPNLYSRWKGEIATDPKNQFPKEWPQHPDDVQHRIDDLAKPLSQSKNKNILDVSKSEMESQSGGSRQITPDQKVRPALARIKANDGKMTQGEWEALAEHSDWRMADATIRYTEGTSGGKSSSQYTVKVKDLSREVDNLLENGLSVDAVYLLGWR